MGVEVFRHARRRSRFHSLDAKTRVDASWKPEDADQRTAKRARLSDAGDAEWQHARNRPDKDPHRRMTTLTCEYGNTTLTAAVHDERLAAVRVPKSVAALRDPRAAITAALEHPLDSPSFAELIRPARSLLVVTVDRTRPSPAALLQPLLAACAAQGTSVTICIATGHHRKMTAPELDQHLGSEIARAYPIEQHDAFDDALFDDRGVTSFGTRIRVNRIVYQHDLVVGVGWIEPTYLCGFSGGRKIIMPGLAHHTDIDDNHFMLLAQGPLPGQLAGNRMSEDCEEFARRVPFHFILNAVVNDEDQPVAVVAGNPFSAHRKGCDLSAEIFGAAPVTADIVISSPGGHPYDTDLVQGKKGILPAQQAVAQGGVIILIAACPECFGAEKDFIHWLRTYPPEVITQRVHERIHFTLGAHGANVMAKPVVQKGATIILVADEPMRTQVEGTFIRTAPDLESALRMATAARGSASTIALLRKSRRLFLRQA